MKCEKEQSRREESDVYIVEADGEAEEDEERSEEGEEKSDMNEN